MTGVSYTALSSIAHRLRSSWHSSSFSDCRAPPHCSPARAHGCYRRMQIHSKPCTPQYTAHCTSSTHTDIQPRTSTRTKVQALQAKCRILSSLRSSSVVLLTCRVGGMLMHCSYVRRAVVFLGPSTLHTLRSASSSAALRWLPRDFPRGVRRNTRVATIIVSSRVCALEGCSSRARHRILPALCYSAAAIWSPALQMGATRRCTVGLLSAANLCRMQARTHRT